VPDRHPTASRIIAEGLRLFAESGVAGTPIVKIEEAADLAPGSGAFYKHFRSKAELLDAAVADAAATSSAGAARFEALDGFPLEDQARFIARGTWFVFDAHHDLFLVLTRETKLRPRSYTHDPGGWPGDGPAFVAEWLDRQIAAGQIDELDSRAAALVLLDALTFFWLQRETESETPYGVDHSRFVEAWVRLVVALLDSDRNAMRSM
jgi:AcrR family transcriptional regulator